MAAPICPRCGYDLSGLTASWTLSCPLRTTCAECGLEFSCANVLSPRLLGPPWSYEHSLTPRIGRFWRTSAAAISATRLCSGLSVDHRIRPGRLLRFAAWWLLIGHLGLVAITLGAWLHRSVADAGEFWTGLAQLVNALLSEVSSLLRLLIFPYAPPRPMLSSGNLAGSPVAPLAMLVYAPTLLMPFWMTVLGDSMAAARVRPVHLLRGLAYSLPGAVLWTLLLPMVVWVVPQLEARFGGTVASPVIDIAGALTVIVGFPVCHGAWWYLFIRRYLRLRHAAMVVLLLMIASGLVDAILLVCAYILSMRT